MVDVTSNSSLDLSGNDFSIPPSPKEINHKDLSCSFSGSISSIENESNPPTPHNPGIPAESTESPQRRRRNKEDLNKTPLPIFSCIYCSNEDLSFKHLSNTIISDNYLYMTSVYDIKLISDIISNPRSLLEITADSVVINTIINNTEYVEKDYKSEEIKKYFKGVKDDMTILHNIFIDKLENYITRKKSRKLITSSIVRNVSLKKNNSEISNSVNSISLNLNENPAKQQVNSIGLDSIVENISNISDEEEGEEGGEDFFNFLKFDLKRKITKNDIEWDSNCFDIWDPVFESTAFCEEKAHKNSFCSFNSSTQTTKERKYIRSFSKQSTNTNDNKISISNSSKEIHYKKIIPKYNKDFRRKVKDILDLISI